MPTVAQAAASPTAIVLAGAGVAVGELAHLGLVVAIVFGGVAYGARVAYAAVHRRLALQGRARRRLARIDPWSVPEPWRSYTTRALEARKRYRQLAADCPPGPVADYLANSVAKVDAATEEHWALAKSGAGLVDPPGRTERAAKSLEEVQAELLRLAARTVPGLKAARRNLPPSCVPSGTWSLSAGRYRTICPS